MREICTTAYKYYETSMTVEVRTESKLMLKKRGQRLIFVCFLYNKQHSFKSYVAIHSIPQQVKWFNVIVYIDRAVMFPILILVFLFGL